MDSRQILYKGRARVVDENAERFPLFIWERAVAFLDRRQRLGLRLVCQTWKRWVYRMEDSDVERHVLCNRKGCGNRGAKRMLQENAYVMDDSILSPLDGLPKTREMPDYILDRSRSRLICTRCIKKVKRKSRDLDGLRVFFFEDKETSLAI